MATEAKNECDIVVAEVPRPIGRPRLSGENATEGHLAAREYLRIAAKKTFTKAKETKKFECPLCKKCFGTRQSWKYHTQIAAVHK